MQAPDSGHLHEQTVMLALPVSAKLATAIVRCDWVEPHVMAAFVIDWQRVQRERAAGFGDD